MAETEGRKKDDGADLAAQQQQGAQGQEAEGANADAKVKGGSPTDLLKKKLAFRRNRRGPDGKLPHKDKMQAGFGQNLDGINAVTGPEGKEAADAAGSKAVTVGQ